MVNIRILSPDLVEVQVLEKVAAEEEIKTINGKLKPMVKPTTVVGLKPQPEHLKIPMEVVAEINNLKTPMGALVDLWTSVLKSALPLLPEFSVLVLQDVLKDALEIKCVYSSSNF